MKLFKWLKSDWKLVEVYKLHTQELHTFDMDFGKFIVYAQLYYSKRKDKYKYEIQNDKTESSRREIIYTIQKDIIKFQECNKHKSYDASN